MWLNRQGVLGVVFLLSGYPLSTDLVRVFGIRLGHWKAALG
jgi:hypothetical protein